MELYIITCLESPVAYASTCGIIHHNIQSKNRVKSMYYTYCSQT